MKVLPLFLASFLFLGTTVHGQEESRTWTNAKGQKIAAKLVKQEDGHVTRLLGTGRTAKIAANTLSKEDQEYLAGLMKKPEPAPTPPAGGSTDSGTEAPSELPADFAPVPGHPEDDVDVVRDTIKTTKEQFEAGKMGEYVKKTASTETPHFLIIHDSRNTKVGDVAQAAERIWGGMAKQYFGFSELFGDKKHLILVASEEETWSSFGQWYRDTPDWTESQERYWKREKGHRIKLKPEFVESHGLLPYGTALNGLNKDHVTGKYPPLVTHMLTYDMMTAYLAPATPSDKGVYTFTVGQAYFKESVLAGEATTALLDKSDYTRDKFAQKSDFGRGKNWAKTAKQMIAKEEIKPLLGDVLDKAKTVIQPTDFILMYSLNSFMNQTPERLRAKNEMLLTIRKTKKGPTEQEFITALGYDSPDDFHKDWMEFIQSRDFE